jgi:hypothetical protein
LAIVSALSRAKVRVRLRKASDTDVVARSVEPATTAEVAKRIGLDG